MESFIVQLGKLFAFGFNTYNVVKVTHLSEPQFPDL